MVGEGLAVSPPHAAKKAKAGTAKAIKMCLNFISFAIVLGKNRKSNQYYQNPFKLCIDYLVGQFVRLGV